MRQADSAMRLDVLQLAWLQELGVDAALLRPYAAAPSVNAATRPTRTASASAMPASTAVRADGADDGPNDDARNVNRQTSAAPSHRSSPPALQISRELRAGRASAARPPAAPSPEARPRAVQAQHPPPQRVPTLACQVYVARDGAVVSDPGQTPLPTWLVMREAALAASDAQAQNRATQLLHAMLAAVRLQPDNAILHLPEPAVLPHPAASEVPALQAQIQDHIHRTQPTCILALGRVAASALLQTTEDLESLRGKVWSYADAAGGQIPVVVTYPPGWLLAHPQHKANVWRDLLLARAARLNNLGKV